MYHFSHKSTEASTRTRAHKHTPLPPHTNHALNYICFSECTNSKYISLSVTPFFWFHNLIRLWKARRSQREGNLTGEISEKLKEEQINELVIQAAQEKLRWFNSSYSLWQAVFYNSPILCFSIKACNQCLFMREFLRSHYLFNINH